MTEDSNQTDLWDGSGEPDAELRELERALRPHRWQGPAAQLDTGEQVTPPRPVKRSPRVFPRLAFAAVILLGLGLILRQVAFEARGPYEVEWQAADGSSRNVILGPGDRLSAPHHASAFMKVTDIGWLELEAGGELRVAANIDRDGSDAEHLFHLERGRLRASIFAAPRVFQVGTPGGLAVDLGCVYSTEVFDDGLTLLHVESGQVSFESASRQVSVPSGASLMARPTLGPGTPAWDDASDAFLELLDRVDTGHATQQDLAQVLAHDDPRDSLSLAHLLDVAPTDWRAALVERLAQLETPSDPSWPARVMAGEAVALRSWKREMSWSW